MGVVTPEIAVSGSIPDVSIQCFITYHHFIPVSTEIYCHYSGQAYIPILV